MHVAYPAPLKPAVVFVVMTRHGRVARTPTFRDELVLLSGWRSHAANNGSARITAHIWEHYQGTQGLAYGSGTQYEWLKAFNWRSASGSRHTAAGTGIIDNHDAIINAFLD